MKIRIQVLLSLLICGIVESAYAQDKAPAVMDAAAWPTYRNTSLGIEFRYPKAWAFHESPGNRVIASFSFITGQGNLGNFILADMSPVRSTFASFLERNKKQLAKAKRIPVGSEEGFEQDQFQCGQEEPSSPQICTAFFQFDSPALFSRGLDVSMTITLRHKESTELGPHTDPSMTFKKEVDLARQLLATLKLAK